VTVDWIFRFTVLLVLLVKTATLDRPVVTVERKPEVVLPNFVSRPTLEIKVKVPRPTIVEPISP
jgi:hypothetical protein